MIFLKYLILNCFILFVFVLNSYAQVDNDDYSDGSIYTKEGWQRQMDDYTAKKVELTGKLIVIDKDIELLKKTKINYDSIRRNLQSDIYFLIDSDSSLVVDFNDRFETTEKKILNKSAPLSDIKEYWFDWISGNKIRLLSQYRFRYNTMKKKIDNWKDE